jgi:ribosomal protein S18 acetylase RimI-like enzyme
MPPPDGDWDRSWVAENARGLIGVGLSTAGWIDDLWVLPDCRSVGVGSALLLALESEIAERGHDCAGLRVVSENHGARRFYAAHGWREIKAYPHERWGFAMVDMEKPLGRSGPAWLPNV